MNVDYIQFQDKVVINIIKHIENRIEVSNTQNTYVNYLKDRTNLKENRIKRILDIGTKRRIMLNELNQIANALNVSVSELFKDI